MKRGPKPLEDAASPALRRMAVLISRGATPTAASIEAADDISLGRCRKRSSVARRLRAAYCRHQAELVAWVGREVAAPKTTGDTFTTIAALRQGLEGRRAVVDDPVRRAVEEQRAIMAAIEEPGRRALEDVRHTIGEIQAALERTLGDLRGAGVVI